MCGACKEGYSLAFDGVRCKRCSNNGLYLVIFLAITGIALVFILSVLNLTISHGTLGGVIFYCNIISSNMTTYFPDRNIWFITDLLKMFVSVLSLQNTLPLCFYHGMDAYWYSWIRFTFPLYLFAVAAMFICAANRCSRIVRNNTVNVLATIILLSYAKLLYISIEALHVTFLHVEGNKHEARWYFDANVRYFTGKHISLALAGFLTGLLILPFTFCLLCIQCLQKVSHHRLFAWVHRLKPFFDAYTGPFNSLTRFWTGLLLLVRALIFIISTASIDSTGNPSINITFISIAAFILLLIASTLPRGLYRRRSLHMLECWILVNLGVLSTFILFSKMIHHEPTAIVVAMASTHTFVGAIFATFIATAVFHASKLKAIRRLKKCVQSGIFKRCARGGKRDRAYYGTKEQNPEQQLLFDENREPNNADF